MKHLILLLLIIACSSCNGPEPRKPVKVKTGSILQKSVERNKDLLAKEEKQIMEIIKNDSLNTYFSSGIGSWYHYIEKNDQTDYYPKTDDLVTLQYNVMTFGNDTIYSKESIGTITYKVDKQDLFPGLRNSIKLLKEKESATFLFPSSLSYGYHGDNNKIGVNVPIKSTITILNIDKQKDNN
ncbi:gliding motility-associated peptidyl-prolyl isomerase [Arenibacter algicola]|jgi:gliding motility-associated peptidyl-prolyl isomerase|uniref:Peptidyl-prolyl cis-trans isomerase n=1 Tax=Arenibacter algicola TaxID=616991 RepID=A0A221V566_9FLAO|nr:MULTISPECIES: gliding motility-associated peptidyl-prolyl isomerase GldI [Arenibacter]ASO08231.1 putative FKBP-type peptidyl-prolyl cis-trans isomerase FkpA [Arenibacter algicola]GBF19901.1 putative FKBP-type peptidyl-prolyl cis-trans isomerase FkpA precursor [Arenibacter sp. NBRC 103722]|tara:strand:+ start:438 stop:983 length:546 start_codon:yes stop_codon:yes gene_type:complete